MNSPLPQQSRRILDLMVLYHLICQSKKARFEAKVWAVDFDEAASRLDQYLETCKDD